MKKQGILNSEIAKVLADMGHTDTLCIGDCGLPVPAEVKKSIWRSSWGSLLLLRF